MEALRAERVHKSIDGAAILTDVSFAVEAGERRAIIGPNGAGKTTLFNIVAGLVPATSGGLFLFGQEISGLPVHERARHGLAKTFQRTHLFFDLSVLENVLLCLLRGRHRLLGLVASHRRDRELQRRAREILAEWGLEQHLHTPARELSHGDQRCLELALGFATEPRVLLLDEPTAGLSDAERRRLAARIGEMPRDVTLLLIDHDMGMVFSLADSVTVLNYGRIVTEGGWDEVTSDRTVQEIYLGLGMRARA
ncbi:ABC transporter ATP-binding protein [Limnochorda pilosa]|uniref:ABC transporter n=1 Tax=Limnochorda pilosa TaxID=1555112 RepID=A0A0K2SLL0_LIMPI|nr:ABC transporter ATP-binding protein [Limnochorda pilosa]BAS28003.1 ABC transporter [Limnochorda pilosa]